MEPRGKRFGTSISQFYDSNLASTEEHINNLDALYCLPLFAFDDLVSKELFHYCKKRSFFVNIIAFQGNRVFLRRAIGDHLGWELPGSAIKSVGNESPNAAVDRILRRDITNVDLTELCPVAKIARTYRWNGQSTTHIGLTYIGRVRSPSPEDIEKNEEIKGRFVSIEDKEELHRMPLLDRFLVGHCISLKSRRAFERFGGKELSPAVDRELDSHRDITKFRRDVHDGLIAKVFASSSRILRKAILDEIGADDTVLDIACGDDALPHLVAQKGNYVVANDVAWSQVLRLGRGDSRAILTNHDARCLPYARTFDVVLCKNVLHHMHELEDTENLFESLTGLARKRILILDPEEPSSGPFRAKVWNSYYMKWLKDQGDHFLTLERFHELITLAFHDRDFDLRFETLNTVKGRYMYAIVERKSPLPVPMTVPGSNSKLWAVFDLDGLLVDSERYFADCVVRALSESEIFVQHADYVKYDLQSGESLLSRLERENKDLHRETVEEYIHTLYASKVSDIPLMPHAKECLKHLQESCNLALFTSSRRAYVDVFLKKFDLAGYFDLIVAREDVTRVKPSPEGLHLIADRAGVEVNELVVIEDSARGLRAAKAVGAGCIVVPNVLTNGEAFSEADVVVTSLKSVTVELLEACIERSRRN